MFAASKTSAASSGYQISRSLRFNSDDSAYLSRTPASASNRKTWTLSLWFKRSALPSSGYQSLIGADSSGGQSFYVAFINSSQQLQMGQGASVYRNTTQVFRDPSAWYHIVVALDTTQATADDRIKIYANGTQITAFSTTTNPSQNDDLAWNSNVGLGVGADITTSGARNFFNGYMTEVNFIDGQALTPSSFGEINAQTGVWQPKAYAGSYGTNGFYLNFSDNSNTTAATLGKDYSGNGNNWTPNNFSVAAGINNDSLTDTPTNNFPTLNPLQTSTVWANMSNGNLDYIDTVNSSSYRSGYSTMFASSGKYYFEATITAVDGTPYPSVGIASPPPQNDAYMEQSIDGYQGYCYISSGEKATAGAYTAFGAAYTAGDTVSVAVDIDAGKVWFAKNGTWQASGDPASGANPAFNIVTGRAYSFAVGNGSSATSIKVSCNYGQRAFLYSAPSDFKSLCTNNLATPTIGATTATQAGKYFNTILWTGDGSNPRAVTGVGFQPDFVWTDRRDVGYGNWLYDVLRGGAKALRGNDTAAEQTYQQVNSFDSDGFTQAGVVDQGNNVSGGQYVAWNWKANGAGVTNTAGSITSTVSANTTSGFSVVTFTTATSGTSTVGHGLGVAPKFVIFKVRSTTGNWICQHASIGTQYLLLNTTDAAATSTGVWNSAPTSTVVNLGSDLSGYGGATAVMYCFAEVAGYSKFGSYIGNSSASGPFVYLGFRPKYVMIKIASGPTYNTDSWFIFDTARGPYNDNNPYLLANTTNSEGAFTAPEMLANGFLVNTTSNALNYNGSTYIYMAFAEAPFKYSLAR